MRPVRPVCARDYQFGAQRGLISGCSCNPLSAQEMADFRGFLLFATPDSRYICASLYREARDEG
jgi:hypothetical protein